MRRARWIAAAVIGWTVCTTASLLAQTPPDGWVALSLEEYRDLRTRSLRAGLPPPSPADATLTRVDYELRLDGEAMTGRALLTVDVLRDGWARIPIPPGLTVTNATLDGQPVALADGPPPYIVLSRPGRTVVALDIVVPLTASAGTESIALPAAPVPMTRATLALARSGLDLSVTGGFIAERTTAADESQWTMFGRPNEPLKLTWKRRIDDRRASMPLRLRGRLLQLVSYGEDGCRMSASVRAEVVQGSMQEVTLMLPPGMIVNEVNGPTVADWEAADGRLRVRLLEPVITDASFVVASEMRAGRDGGMTVPMLRLPEAERESGGVAVDITGAGEIVAGRALGLEPTDSSGAFAFEHVPSGNATVMATLPGFQTVRVEFAVGGVGMRVDMKMGIAALAETIMVTAQSTRRNEQKEEDVIVEPSSSVVGIQRKVAGVLPIPIDVPRTGVNLRFSRPLVLDDETRVDFRYKRR